MATDTETSPALAAGAIVTARAAGCTMALARGDGELLRSWLEAGLAAGAGCVEVKRSTVRTVLAGSPPGTGLDVHAKLYRAVRLSDRARDLLTGSRGRVEFDNLWRARALGLPAVEPLAFGTLLVDGARRAFLVTRTWPGQPLPRTALDAADARAAGALLRRVHDAGLEARDLHPGNLLRDEDGGLALVDLTTVRFGPPLELDPRAQALAFFCLDLDGGPRHPAAQPLLDAYAASPLLRERAERCWRRLRVRALRAFGRRAFRPCAHTAVEGRRGALTLRWRAADGGPIPTFPELAAAEEVKRGRRGGVWLRGDDAVKVREPAAARRLWRAAYWLTYAGVPTAEPRWLQLDRIRGLVGCERIPADDLARLVASGGLDPETATAAAARLGDAVGRLHGHGLRNRDLKLENLVLDPRDGAVRMVDLDGVRRKPPPADGRGRVADLARLLASFDELGRPGGTRAMAAFLRAYNRARAWMHSARLTPFERRRIAAGARGRSARSPTTPSS